jgi:hypothetical protein
MTQIHQHDTKPLILALSNLSIFMEICNYATNLEFVHNNRASVVYMVTIDLKKG